MNRPLCGLVILATVAPVQGYTLRQTLDAIRTVETGGGVSDGDGGRAVGPYQIWRCYWQDSGVAGEYEQCREREYAERVVVAYMQRYCPQAIAGAEVDAETIARTHVGGPKGATKDATLPYWRRVRSVLQNVDN